MPSIVVIWSLSHVQLFATPWTAAYKASLSSTISQSLLKLISNELECDLTISPLAILFSFCLQSFSAFYIEYLIVLPILFFTINDKLVCFHDNVSYFC